MLFSMPLFVEFLGLSAMFSDSNSLSLIHFTLPKLIELFYRSGIRLNLKVLPPDIG